MASNHSYVNDAMVFAILQGADEFYAGKSH
jgi:hypothetical protein